MYILQEGSLKTPEKEEELWFLIYCRECSCAFEVEKKESCVNNTLWRCFKSGFFKSLYIDCPHCGDTKIIEESRGEREPFHRSKNFAGEAKKVL